MLSQLFKKESAVENFLLHSLKKLFGTDRPWVIPKNLSVTGTIWRFFFKSPGCFLLCLVLQKRVVQGNQDRVVGAPLLIVWRKSALCKKCHQRQRVCKERTNWEAQSTTGSSRVRNRRSRIRDRGQILLASGLRQTSGEGGSRGRVRDQRVGPALKRAKRNQNGTDGCRIRFRQFFISSLPRLGNCISRCCTFCRKTS